MPNPRTHSCEREPHEGGGVKKEQGGQRNRGEAQEASEWEDGEVQAIEEWEA